MSVESAERPESTWARAERLEAALWVVALFWSALVLAMAALTPVSRLAILILAPISLAAGLSVCLLLRKIFARPRGRA
jgi:hypothetical protein